MLINALHRRPQSRRQHVAVRAVRDVVTVLLQPVRHWKLKAQPFAQTNRLRVLEDLRILSVRSIETDVGPRSLIAFGMRVDQITIGPLVVGPPRVVGTLQQDVGGPVVTHDEHNIVLPVTEAR